MKYTKNQIRNNRALLYAVLIVLVFVAAGCSLKEINEQTSLVDNAGSIKGKIKVTSDQSILVNEVKDHDRAGLVAGYFDLTLAAPRIINERCLFIYLLEGTTCCDKY